MTIEENRNCPQCDAKPGEVHRDWDDIARCKYTGIQLIQCGWSYDDEEDIDYNREQQERYLTLHEACVCKPDVWDGEYPGVKRCRELGLFTEPNSPWGVTEDLNKLHSSCKWNSETQQFDPVS